MNRFGYFLAFFSLLIGGLLACKSGEKTTVEAQKNQNSVQLESTSNGTPAFSIKEVQAQNRNGLVYVAIVSEQGSMIQLNEISEKMLKSGTLTGAQFKLVFLPGGNQPACVSTNPLNNRLSLEVKGEQVRLRLWGEVQCTSFAFPCKAQVQFSKPRPEFIMPNH